MGNKDMSTCIVCGKKYKTCLSCRNEVALKPWRSVADKIECYEIFLILSQYNNGYLNKDEAKKRLERIKYDEKDLRQSVRNIIREIMSSAKKADKTDKSAKIEK